MEVIIKPNLYYQNKPIRIIQVDEAVYFNGNDICRIFYKQPEQFIHLEETVQAIVLLNSNYDVEEHLLPLIDDSGGIWLNIPLATMLARWVGIEFEIWFLIQISENAYKFDIVSEIQKILIQTQQVLSTAKDLGKQNTQSSYEKPKFKDDIVKNTINPYPYNVQETKNKVKNFVRNYAKDKDMQEWDAWNELYYEYQRIHEVELKKMPKSIEGQSVIDRVCEAGLIFELFDVAYNYFEGYSSEYDYFASKTPESSNNNTDSKQTWEVPAWLSRTEEPPF